VSDAARQLANVLVPYSANYTLIRVGPDKDGGYVLPEVFCTTATELYSFGIGNDVSFEMDFATRFPTAKQFLFDHTIEGLPEKHPNFKFIQSGLGTDFTETTNTIAGHVASQWHEPKTHNRILKIDIEWNEWDTLAATPVEVLRMFDVILCEFHIAPIRYDVTGMSPYFSEYHARIGKEVTDRLLSWYAATLKKVQISHTIVHMHANNSLPAESYDGIKIPQLLEVTFVCNDLATFKPYSGTFPTALDAPNKPYKPDVTGWYPFYGA
jgi:hypothetical protein